MSKFKQPLLTVDPLQQMEHLRTVISQESISMPGIVRSLQSLIPDLQKQFHGFLSGFSKSEPAIQLKANERDFVKLLDGKVYLNLAPLLTYVPEGLEVSYVEYLRVLKDAVQHCHDTALKTLNDYSTYLAQIITNRQLKMTTMPHDAMYVKMEKIRDELTRRMGECFKNGSVKAESTYGDVVARNNEWTEVFQLLSQVDHIANTIRRDDLHKKAEECNTQLTTIIKQIKNNEFEGAGPEVTKNLSNGAYQAGAELELFAVTYFRVMTINQAIADTIKHVTEILTQK